MNSILGARIRDLRESKGLTQEQMAQAMKCTRQKYARIEKGLIDISYANITMIAKILGVTSEEITSSVNRHEQRMLRDYNSNGDQFNFVSEMIDTFYAHRRLYNGVKQGDENESE